MTVKHGNGSVVLWGFLAASGSVRHGLTNEFCSPRRGFTGVMQHWSKVHRKLHLSMTQLFNIFSSGLLKFHT